MDAAEQAGLAEKNGFDSVLSGDDFANAPPPIAQAGLFGSAFSVATTIAMKTKRVTINVLTDPWKRHPAIVAQEIATIDSLSQGRAALTLGGGEAMNFIPFGIKWEKPLETLREAIIVIRMLWSASREKPAEYKGRIYNLQGNAFMRPNPTQKPRVPIYLAAWRPRMLRLTGELADGHLPWITSPLSFSRRLRRIKDGAVGASRNLANIDKAVWLPLVVDEDYESAYNSIESVVKTCLILEGEVLRYHGCKVVTETRLDERSSLFTDRDLELLVNAHAQIPRQIVESCCAIGTVEDCIKRVEEFIGLGAEHVLFSDFGKDFGDTMDTLGREVLPYFRGK